MSGSFVQAGGLELRHLQALQAVAAEGSFGRAALRLGFTQSAVSQQIAALERIVGLELFDRPGGPRPVRLTQAGALLLGHAEAILDRVTAAEAAIASLRSGETGRVRIGTFQSISVQVLPGVVTELKRLRPGIDVQLMETDAAEPSVEAMAAGTLDLAFVVAPFARDGLEVTELFEDPYVLLCPPGSPLAHHDGPVPAEALAGLALVGQPSNSCQGRIERWLVRGGVAPNVVFRSSDNAAVQAMVRAGIGHSVMPSLAIDPSDPEVAVAQVTLAPRRIAMITPVGGTTSAAALFRELVMAWFEARVSGTTLARTG